MSRVESWLETPAATKLLGWLTLAFVLTVLVLVAVTVPSIRSDTRASRRTDDLASCRAEFRAKIDDATVVLADATADVQTQLSAAVVASIRQDPTTLQLIAEELAAAESAKHAAIDNLYAASDNYKAAVTRSREAPGDFLDACKGTT